MTDRFTIAAGNRPPIGGLKVITNNGWLSLSGTEEAYKIYCESFLDAEHREKIEHKAVEIFAEVLASAK
ncbi:MAG: hypothetical protein G5663_02110 [Serratia symbiotica]|nr:hypothetical protein [Serratia symbiotica]